MRFFGMIRFYGRPQLTRMTLAGLAGTDGIEQIELCGLFTPSEELSLDGMRRISEETGVSIGTWVETAKPYPAAFRLALALGRLAVLEGRADWVFWLDNDVLLNADWLERLVRLHSATLEAYPGGVVWSSAIRNKLQPVWPDGSERFVGRFVGSPVALFDADMLRRVPLLDPMWNVNLTGDFIASALYRERINPNAVHVLPVESMADHMGGEGLTTRGAKVYELSRGIGFSPDANAKRALGVLDPAGVMAARGPGAV